jgi:hypothetical protein
MLLLGGLLFSGVVYAQKFYRYKNSQGQIILVDQLTPEAISAGYEVINEEGKLVQTVPPAKTLGELEQEKQRQLELKRKKREEQRQLRRDAELLRLFGSVDDIMRARDAALLGVEQRAELNNNDQRLLTAALEDLQRRAADYERLGQPVPKALQDNIREQQKQIADRERNKLVIEEERKQIIASFEQDMIRFKELQAKRMAHKIQNQRSSETPNNVLMLTCSDNEECRSMWQLAQVYAQSKASGRLEVVTDTIILTSAPKADSEVGISFTKLPSRNLTQIILEISCNTTEAGQQLCESSEAKKLLTGFEDFIKKQLR